MSIYERHVFMFVSKMRIQRRHGDGPVAILVRAMQRSETDRTIRRIIFRLDIESLPFRQWHQAGITGPKSGRTTATVLVPIAFHVQAGLRIHLIRYPDRFSAIGLRRVRVFYPGVARQMRTFLLLTWKNVTMQNSTWTIGKDC